MIIGIKEMQSYGKEMLQEVIDVFERNNLVYYACFGTVLGAVRHKDIIPWDHDIDLAIPITEREKVNKVLIEQLDPKYKVWTPQDNGFGLLFTRIGLAGYKHEKLHIDLYYIVGAPEGEKLQRRFTYETAKVSRLLQDKYYVHFSKENSFLGRLKVACLKIRASLFSEKYLRGKFERLLKMYDYESAQYITIPIEVYGTKKIFNKQVFGLGTQQEFGEITIVIPMDYTQYLEQIYGDYMKYPEKNHIDKMLNTMWKIEQNKGAY